MRKTKFLNSDDSSGFQMNHKKPLFVMSPIKTSQVKTSSIKTSSMKKLSIKTSLIKTSSIKMSPVKMSAINMSSIVMLLLCSAVVGVVGSTGEGRNPNFLATENSNLEVLKELGMDIQNEGKNEQTYFLQIII
jgi:hypothetical protein